MAPWTRIERSLRPAAILGRRLLRTRLRAIKRDGAAATVVVCRALRAFVDAARARFFLFASAQEATARVRDLQRQVAAARGEVATYRERIRRLERALGSAESALGARTQTARANVEEMVQGSRAATDEIIRAAQRTATAALAEARAAADATAGAAREWADLTLQETRARAQEEVDAIERAAAERIEPLEAAADRLISDARRMVQDMEDRIQASAAELSAKVAAFEAERDEYSEGLAALIMRHAETVERVSHLQAEVEDRLLPALGRLTSGLQGAETSWLRSSPNKPSPGRERRTGASHGTARPAPSSSIDGEARRVARSSGEITIDHVRSFREATKLVRGLSELAGVETVRLRTYGNGVATIDVTAEGPLAALDVKRLEGFALEVVQAAPGQLVIHLSHRSRLVAPG